MEEKFTGRQFLDSLKQFCRSGFVWISINFLDAHPELSFGNESRSDLCRTVKCLIKLLVAADKYAFRRSENMISNTTDGPVKFM
jgi:hypothetical protein